MIFMLKPSPPKLFNYVIDEIRKFTCSNDRRYLKLKRELAKQADHSRLVVVSGISAAVGANLGAEIGGIVPLVAIVLIIVLKIGREDFCRIAQILEMDNSSPKHC
jgi:hypothetical protein